MTIAEISVYLLAAIGGTLAGSLISFIPGLHAFNLAGFAILLYIAFPAFDPLLLAMVMAGLVVGYAVISSAGSVYFSTPDDSLRFTRLPSQRYLLQGRGHEAVMLLGIGSLGGLLFLLVVAPIASPILYQLRRLLTPHLWWILGLVILYMLQSEWPRDYGSRALTRLGRLWDGWSSLLAGILVFLLSGAVGLILVNRSIVPIDRSFQNIVPAFIGFVAIPWNLTNLISRIEIPKQHVSNTISANKAEIARGVSSGALGGSVAAYTPIVTAGIGSFLAGHSTSTRGDVQFTVSYGAARFVYYVGAYMLLWIPLVHLARGGMGWIMSVAYSPKEAWEFWLFLGAMALSGIVAFCILLGMSRYLARALERWGYRNISLAMLVALVAIVFALGSWQGLVLMTICTGIGLIQITFRTRWMNCMGILLVPIFLNMAGWGPRIVEFLGLV